MNRFDMIADRYDTQERREIAKIIADKILLTCDLHDKDVIDFGCGTGLVGLELADTAQSVTFVDSSKNMIDILDGKIADIDDKHKLRTLHADLTVNIPENLTADCIIMSQTLLHIRDTDMIISRLSELLGERGQLIVVDFDTQPEVLHDEVHGGFDQQKLGKQMRAQGFTHVQSQTFYHGKNIFMNKDASLFIMVAEK